MHTAPSSLERPRVRCGLAPTAPRPARHAGPALAPALALASSLLACGATRAAAPSPAGAERPRVAAPSAVYPQHALAPLRDLGPEANAAVAVLALGALRVRGSVERLAHPRGGAVLRAPLVLENAGTEAVYVRPEAFFAGALRPWRAGVRCPEGSLAPGAARPCVLAFREPAGEPSPSAAGTLALALRREDQPAERATLGPVTLAVRSLAAPGAALLLAERVAAAADDAPARGEALTLRVGTQTLQREGDEWRARVEVTVANLTRSALRFDPAQLWCSSGAGAAGPAAPPETLAEGELAPFHALRGVVSCATGLRGARPDPVALRLTYGALGKGPLDLVLQLAGAPRPLDPKDVAGGALASPSAGAGALAVTDDALAPWVAHALRSLSGG